MRKAFPPAVAILFATSAYAGDWQDYVNRLRSEAPKSNKEEGPPDLAKFACTPITRANQKTETNPVVRINIGFWKDGGMGNTPRA